MLDFEWYLQAHSDVLCVGSGVNWRWRRCHFDVISAAKCQLLSRFKTKSILVLCRNVCTQNITEFIVDSNSLCSRPCSRRNCQSAAMVDDRYEFILLVSLNNARRKVFYTLWSLH